MDFYIPFFSYSKPKEFRNVRSWRVVDPNEDIRTGDIFLFSGSSFSSSMVKLFTSSKWNHIGIVCWCELEYLNGKISVDLFSFELGSLGYVDLMTGEIASKKVRLVRFADVVGMYDMVAVRTINSNRKTQDARDAWCNRFTEFMLKWKRTPFFDFHVMIKAHFVYAGDTPSDQTTCSHLAAMMLDHMKVFKSTFELDQISPEDFTKSSKAFPEGVFVGDEFVVYHDKKLISNRIIFISVVLITAIVIFILLIRRYFKNKNPQV